MPRLAECAGFCQGVRRALDLALAAAAEPGPWCTLGPLVHNDAVVEFLEARGIRAVERVEEAAGSGLIIRSHGASPGVLAAAQAIARQVVDATCPLVKRVQTLARQMVQEGYRVVIVGDAAHPEVQGIVGWAEGQATVVASVEEARRVTPAPRLAVLAQTTREQETFFDITRELLPKSLEVRAFNTICDATRKRQQAAREVCRDVDVMVVVGDFKSSNTATLARVCADTGVRTYRVERAGDLNPEWFAAGARAGVTAGASTPEWIIKEVVDTMVEFEENAARDEAQENQPEPQAQAQQEETWQEPQPEPEEAREQSFMELEAEMAESMSKGMERGSILKGVVIQVSDDEVMVDVGGKSEGVIPLRELSVRDLRSAREEVQVGDEIEVYVLRWDDDGTILLSKKRVDMKKALDALEEKFHNREVIDAKVVKSVKGGLLVDIGVVAFLPASHVDEGFVRNLDDYIGQTMPVRIIEFNRAKRRGSQVVVSRKDVLSEQRERQREEFWSTIEEGQVRTGRVKRLTDYGAFIDLGGFEGLLHISEMAHVRVDHPSDVLSEGDVIDVYILGVDREKERVSLSRKRILKSPWETVLERYREGDIIDGKVVRLAPFGAFVEVEPGVDGLIHISQLSHQRIEKPEDVVQVGDQVRVKILGIDPVEKRIALSLKEAEGSEAVDYEGEW
ncbi:MAG: bifunctional 4-hydroxy-3-methylbut-2-enyl diphosphate reductase/30S ribosomal protein S1 [Syntrophomonadaceae bacterium]|nr:bifunctional 4-hydroxy-3-methylbut-2-enyl diphosphate reductase/30S ribosomal protein S1 [Syntrophomonadaceae bacterium]MDH7497928.1 bifunctional 4-hydroxy-3-methylbut-2-enyl diphosphate reductase/30S ribosomal protein S1 [Syntrophomonadaceae bacterium]